MADYKLIIIGTGPGGYEAALRAAKFGKKVAVVERREVGRDGRGIAVNEHFETSLPHIYAIGDVSSKIWLAHVATAQGITCVERLCGSV